MKQLAPNPFIRSILNSAVAAHKAGDFDKAEAQYRQVLKSSPQEFDALSLLGALLSQRQDFGKGLDYLRSALKLRPQSLNLLLNTGLCLQELGRSTEALSMFESGLRLKPNSAEFLRGQALALYRLQKYAESLRCFENMAAKGLCTKEDGINHGLTLYELNRFEESLAKLTKASRADPSNPSLLYNIGRCLLKLGLLEPALAALDAALKISPDDRKTLIARSETAREMNDSASALETIERAVKADAENSYARGLKASLLLDLGRKTEAAEIFRDLAAKQRQIGDALQGLAQCKTYSMIDADAEMILGGRSLPNVNPATLSLIHFGASKCLNDLERYDEALLAAAEARKLRPVTRQKDYNFEAIRTAFSRRSVENFSLTGNSSKQPIFIVGMPRSGTSLIEQIIATHPQAGGAGELRDMIRIGTKLGALENNSASIQKSLGLWTSEILDKAAADYLQALQRGRPNTARIVDKMPHNFMLVGVISVLFPNAKIIHSKRNAADTCVSIFLNDLKGSHGYANDLRSLGKYYTDYEHLMRHWGELFGAKIYTCSYEEMVKNPEQEIRQLLNHLDLPWDEKCLRFFDTERTVTTLSRAQVREPLYASSVGRWKKYEKHLVPLLEELASL